MASHRKEFQGEALGPLPGQLVEDVLSHVGAAQSAPVHDVRAQGGPGWATGSLAGL